MSYGIAQDCNKGVETRRKFISNWGIPGIQRCIMLNTTMHHLQFHDVSTCSMILPLKMAKWWSHVGPKHVGWVGDTLTVVHASMPNSWTRCPNGDVASPTASISIAVPVVAGWLDAGETPLSFLHSNCSGNGKIHKNSLFYTVGYVRIPSVAWILSAKEFCSQTLAGTTHHEHTQRRRKCLHAGVNSEQHCITK